jgi:GTP1/Obg family GTP-binding protein/tetratricopeptide (TPR) repeat protein
MIRTFKGFTKPRRALLECYFSTQQENDWTAATTLLNNIVPHWREETAHALAEQGLSSCRNANVLGGIEKFEKGLRVLSSSEENSSSDENNFEKSPTARHLHNCLGLAKQAQSKYAEAEKSLQTAFDICDGPETLGLGDDQHIDRTGLLVDLATNLMFQGAWDQADKLLRRCHYSATRAYRPSQQLVATVLACQGELEWLRGKTKRAQKLMMDARDVLDAASSVPCDAMDGTSFDLLIQWSLARYALSLGNLEDATKLTDIVVESSFKQSLQCNLEHKQKQKEKKTPYAEDECNHIDHLTHRLLEGRLCTQRALLCSLQGQHEQAKELHNQAYDILSNNDAVFLNTTTIAPLDIAVAMHNKGMYSDSREEAHEMYNHAANCLKRIPDQRMYRASISNMQTAAQERKTKTTSLQAGSMVVPVRLPNVPFPMLQLNHTAPLTGLAISMLPHRAKPNAATTSNNTLNMSNTRNFSTTRMVRNDPNADSVVDSVQFSRLSYLPHVRPASELLGATFWDESERVAVKKHKDKATPHPKDRAFKSNIKIMLDRMSTQDAMAGIDYMAQELKQRMIFDIKNIPNSTAYHPYEQALIDLTLGPKFPQQEKISSNGQGLLLYDDIIKRAKTVAYKRIDEITNALRRRSNRGVVKRKRNRKQGEEEQIRGGVGWNLLREGREQLSSVLTNHSKKGNEWERLGNMIGQLRQIPSVRLPFENVDYGCSPIVLVGAPNVGKSSIVSIISSKQPEVNHYPFTTRGILIGNMEWNGNSHGTSQQQHQCQVMDTPGLLHRPVQERNSIELLTLASLSYLPSCIIMYVTDLTETSTVSHEDQMRLREDVHANFASATHIKGWVDVCGKSDMNLNKSFQSHIDASILVSCHEEHGIDTLVSTLQEILEASLAYAEEEEEVKDML